MRDEWGKEEEDEEEEEADQMPEEEEKEEEEEEEEQEEEESVKWEWTDVVLSSRLETFNREPEVPSSSSKISHESKSK